MSTHTEINAALAEFERMHPAKDRPVKIRCGKKLWEGLSDEVPNHKGDFLAGLPIALDDSLSYPRYVIEYADGFEVEIINGVKVRRKTQK